MPRPDILAFGDSLTAGYGLAPAEAFPHALEVLLRERQPGAGVRNAGVSGDTSGDGRERLPRVVGRLTAKPDLAIVELGANDLLRAIPPARMADNLDWIVGELTRCGIPVLLAGMWAPPFLGTFAQHYNAVFPAVATRHGAALYPHFLDGVMGDPSLTLRDRIHPTARAIGIVADRILPHVEAALARADRQAA